MDYTRANIEYLRGRRSIKQVGEESLVGQSWLQRYMHPEKPSGIRKANAEKLGQLARYFGVSVDELTKDELSGGVQIRPTQSQSARLDVGKLAGLIEAVESAAGDSELEMDARFRSRVIAALYANSGEEPLTANAVRAALLAVMSSLEE